MDASQNNTNGHSQSTTLGNFSFDAYPEAISLYASPVGTAPMKQNFKPEEYTENQILLQFSYFIHTPLRNNTEKLTWETG